MSLSLVLLTAHSRTLMVPAVHLQSVSALQGLAGLFQDVDAILVASSHWLVQCGFVANAASRPAWLQDYYGFPPEFYAVRYEPPGDPDPGGCGAGAGSNKPSGAPGRDRRYGRQGCVPLSCCSSLGPTDDERN